MIINNDFNYECSNKIQVLSDNIPFSLVQAADEYAEWANKHMDKFKVLEDVVLESDILSIIEKTEMMKFVKNLEEPYGINNNKEN